MPNNVWAVHGGKNCMVFFAGELTFRWTSSTRDSPVTYVYVVTFSKNRMSQTKPLKCRDMKVEEAKVEKKKTYTNETLDMQSKNKGFFLMYIFFFWCKIYKLG